MTIFRKSLAAVAFIAAGTVANAEWSANIGVTSDYVWRGLSQSGEAASVSGGVDYASESGFYIGTWIGSLGDNFAGPDEQEGTGFTGAEVDVYLGFGQEYDNFNWDVGYLYYHYPSTDGIDFGEIYGSIGAGIWSLGAAFTLHGQNEGGAFDAGDLHINTGLSGSISETWSLGGTIGLYTFDADSDINDLDYFYYQVDLGKSTDFGDFTLSAVGTDLDELEGFAFNVGDDDIKFVVSWGIGF